MSDRERERFIQDSIQVSKTVARWLVAYGKQLVDDGFGTNFDPAAPVSSGLEPQNAGFIDEIPMSNGELWRYMNAVINFARTVSAILARELNHSEVSPLSQTFFLEDGDVSEI